MNIGLVGRHKVAISIQCVAMITPVPILGEPESGPLLVPPPAITVQVPTPLRAASNGASELPLSAATVRAALSELAKSHPSLHKSICDETGAVRRHINLFVNSSHIRDLAHLDTALAPGDTLTILPAVSGGLPCPNV